MQVKVYLANLKLNRIYHFEKQKIIANDYLTQTRQIPVLKKSGFCGNITVEKNIEGMNAPYVFLIFAYYQRSRLPYYKYHAMIFLDLQYVRS